jgi:hypothetical protein
MRGSGVAVGPVCRNPSSVERHGGAAGRGTGRCAHQRPLHLSPHAGATEIRRTFWISLGAVVPLFFGHLAQVGLWAGFLVLLGTLRTYNDAFYFSLVTFATLGYGDIILASGYRIFGALAALCGSLMLGWSTTLIFGRRLDEPETGRDPE